MKKFSLGISLDLSLEDYKEIFNKYKHNIDEIYFSPPLENKFHSRAKIINSLKDVNNVKKLLNIIKLAIKNNIKIELVINSILFLTEKDVEKCYEWCLENDITINSLCTFNHLVKKAKELFGDINYICSYNQNLRTYDDLKKINPLFKEVVLGNNFIRDVKAFKLLKDRGFKVRVLLNNGCSHNCLWCSTSRGKLCETIFEKNLKNNSFEFLFAIQSVLPFELFEFYEKLDCVDSYKLSSRSQNKKKLLNILKIYIDKDFENNKMNFTSTCLLGSMQEYIMNNFDKLNIDEIIKIKKEYIKNNLI